VEEFADGGLSSTGRHRPNRQTRDRAPRFLRSKTDLIGTLQIEPELRAGADPMAQPQRGVARHGAFATNDLAHTIGGYGDLAGECRRRSAHRFQPQTTPSACDALAVAIGSAPKPPFERESEDGSPIFKNLIF